MADSDNHTTQGDGAPPRHLAELLWAQHHPTEDYPLGVLGVPAPIPGIAFFPGGYGLWRPDIASPLPAFPVGGVMVLGHDFHSESGYRESLRHGRESETQPTWRVLLKVLERVAISPTRCFFTNVYMGLRAGDSPTGPFPGAKRESFVDHCVRFLDRQVAAQRPSLIITLGVNVPPLLARLTPELQDWASHRGLKHLDRVGALRGGVRIGVDQQVETNVVALVHPSMRHACVRHRAYKGLRGDEAEMLLLSEALALSGRR